MMKKIIFASFLVLAFGCNENKETTNSIPADEAFMNREITPAIANNDLFKHLASTPQEFTVDLKRDTSIVCKNGTAISFPENCFVDKEGNVVNEKVDIKVVEVLSMSDFLKKFRRFFAFRHAEMERLLRAGKLS